VHRLGRGRLELSAHSKENKYEHEYLELQHVVEKKMQEYAGAGRARRKMQREVQQMRNLKRRFIDSSGVSKTFRHDAAALSSIRSSSSY
jgi:succinate dehydrogenase/fumarate reductase flavoprotein subunit